MSDNTPPSDPGIPAPPPEYSQSLCAEVPDDMAGLRLDKAAALLFAPHSRARLQQWIKDGKLTTQGRVARSRDSVQAGQVLELQPVPEDRSADELLPADIPLDLVHEDQHLLVLNKPAGLVSHPAPGHRNCTLVNALLHLDPTLAQLPRAGLVHRLDKGTSGLMAVARTEQARLALTAQLAERTMSRVYLALIRGEPVAGSSLTGAIGRHRVQRLKMAVRSDGRPAQTDFRVRNKYSGYTELEVHLKTGRTHQIRVHLTEAGLPLVGDPLYGGGSRPVRGNPEALNAAIRTLDRPALHAFELGLIHPDSGQAMRWKCEPPADYADLRQMLKAAIR